MRAAAFLVLFFALDSVSVGQQPSGSSQSTRESGVPERGDHVMGFSHGATTHHFHLLKNGGEIVVTAKDPGDKTSVEQIRMHMKHIVGMFSSGNFDAPMLIHETNPPGVATMTRLKSDIRYRVSELPDGAMIRIQTSRSETTDAVHAFLLFQIVDHKTGDTPAIGN